MQLEIQSQFKVAPIISDQKFDQLRTQIFETLIGIGKEMKTSVYGIFMYITLPMTCFLVPLLVDNYQAAIIIPTCVLAVGATICEKLRKDSSLSSLEIFFKFLILGSYVFLWSNHIYYLNHQNYDLALLILSAITITTSISTIAIQPVKQFSANSVNYSTLGLDSTLYMRFFIIFPTLLAQFIIDNIHFNNHASIFIYPLRVFISVAFILWWVGWITSLSTTIYFVLNKVNMLVFGDQSKIEIKYTFITLIANMVPIAIYEIVYYQKGSISLQPFIIGMSLASILSYFRYDRSIQNMLINESNKRVIISISIEIVILIILAILYGQANLINTSITIFLSIDIGLYIVFNILKEIAKGWSRFGINFNCKCISLTTLLSIERFTLRAISGLCVLLALVQTLPNFYSIFGYDSNIITYIFIPFLSFRSFKRTLSESRSFSLHFSMLLTLILINTNYGPQSCLAIFFMPSFPSNFYLSIFSAFQIPEKAKHKNQSCFQVIYFCLTLIGVMVHLLTLGIFQLTMIFGLPVYWPIIPTTTAGYSVKSAENTLYQKIIQSIDPSIFKFYELGFYLLRVDKYIILLEVKAQCYGLCEVIEFRGLQVQEVTSCHRKEGQTIDNLVEETWRQNSSFCNLNPYKTTLTPLVIGKVFAPSENDIQLTGVIEAKQFVQLFKSTALKSLIRQYSKLTLSQNQKRQGDVMASQINAFYKKDMAQSIFPLNFAKEFGLNVSYPSARKNKLPPILKQQNNKKNQVLNDFLDLIDNGDQKPQVAETSLQAFQTKQMINNTSEFKKEKLQQINMAVVLTIYYYTVAKQDYVNMERLYRLIKAEKDVISQVQFDQFEKICSLAFGAALKISIDKYIGGQFTVEKEDFQAYDQSSFLGTSDSQEYSKAVMKDKQDIWTISYIKKSLGIKRLAKSETDLYIFKADEAILKSVWNNLRFELLYATNDNDERYSIQTHPTLLRNLWVEACEEPFGYPSYQSGLLISK